MVVVIPLTMYTLFLEDFNSYYLDWQEAITTSPWDFTAADYSKTVNADSAVAHNNRREFCDHTSAYTSFDADYECNSNIHHKALTAHQCWLVKNTGKEGNKRKGKQVTCTLDASPGKIDRADCTAAQYNHGGLGECTAALGVQNYFIIHSFLDAGSSQPESPADAGERRRRPVPRRGLSPAQRTARIHSNANLGYGWIMGAQGTKSEDHFGMIVDPWAVNTTNEHDPDSRDPDDDFKKRVDTYFDTFGIIPGALANLFGIDLASDDLIGWQALTDSVVGDNPITDTLSWKKEYKREVNGHYASGYNDRQESDYNARKDSYLSQDESTW